MEAGGAERQVCYLARGLCAEGHEVHVAILRGGAYYDRLRQSGACIHFVQHDRLYLKTTWMLTQLLRTVKPSVAYLWLRPFDVCGSLAASVTRTPVVHAERTDPRKVPTGAKTFAKQFFVRRSRGVIANSEAGASYWLERAIPRDRVIRIPNAVPTEEMRAVVASPESSGHLIAVGRLDENKNVITVLRAIQVLRAKGLLVKLLVAGNGPCYNTFSQFIADAGLADQVRLLGLRSDAWELMKGSQGLVSLSHHEGEPNVVLEARALGCRLLLSDIPAHRAVASPSDTALVDVNNLNAVAEQLASLYTDKSPRSKAANGTEISLESRSEQSISRQHIVAFRRLGLQVD